MSSMHSVTAMQKIGFGLPLFVSRADCKLFEFSTFALLFNFMANEIEKLFLLFTSVTYSRWYWHRRRGTNFLYFFSFQLKHGNGSGGFVLVLFQLGPRKYTLTPMRIVGRHIAIRGRTCTTAHLFSADNTICMRWLTVRREWNLRASHVARVCKFKVALWAGETCGECVKNFFF